MNERIRKLADEADEYTKQTVHYYQGQFNGLTWEGKIKQTRDTKFAELIVRECMGLCYRIDTEYEGKKVKPTVIASKVAEHFGVEE